MSIFLGVLLAGCRPPAPPPAFVEVGSASLQYTNQRITRVPWSVHVVRIDRQDPKFSLHSAHADGLAIGLAPVSEIVRTLPPQLGQPVAAVNGDFYQRQKEYAGDPRGLQIVEGDLISAPIGGVAFWIDGKGEPHIGAVSNRFRVTLPDGTSHPFGLNSERRSSECVLYSPALGRSTRTSGGREFILEPSATKAWAVLPADQEFTARLLEVRTRGDSPLAPGTLVLSFGPALAKSLPPLAAGAELRLSTQTLPSLAGARTALSGGPGLVHEGRRMKIEPPRSDSYEFSSMLERHPRSAIGWNQTHWFLVQVDGRQNQLSVGMTLDELGAYLADLGCTEAMNLDGGGSATFWMQGAVRNSPCDGHERPVANGLVVLELPQDTKAAAAAQAPAP